MTTPCAEPAPVPRRAAPVRGGAALALVAVAALLAAGSASGGTFTLQDRVPRGGSATVSVTVRAPAAFRILLRTSTSGRTQLFLLGRSAPRGGAILDTSSGGCEGAAGSFYCRGAYEALPKGTYTFRVRRVSGPATPITLAVRW